MPDFDYSSTYARKSDRDFILAAARAYYVDWYIRYAEEHPWVTSACGGGDWLDVAPQTQRWAFVVARQLVGMLEEHYKKPLDDILADWEERWEASKADREYNEINAGFYAAMSAMGQGVGLYDFGIDDRVPYLDCPR